MQRKDEKKTVRQHIIYFAVICCFIAVIRIFEINCPIVYFTGVPCPTCGVTRALLSLLTLNLKGYINYHPFALPLVAAVALMLHAKLFKRKRLVYGFVIAVLTVNFIYYLMKIYSLFF